eukprot:1161900-Pelagomonas_calceolata.AAC.11
MRLVTAASSDSLFTQQKTDTHYTYRHIYTHITHTGGADKDPHGQDPGVPEARPASTVDPWGLVSYSCQKI